MPIGVVMLQCDVANGYAPIDPTRTTVTCTASGTWNSTLTTCVLGTVMQSPDVTALDVYSLQVILTGADWPDPALVASYSVSYTVLNPNAAQLMTPSSYTVGVQRTAYLPAVGLFNNLTIVQDSDSNIENIRARIFVIAYMKKTGADVTPRISTPVIISPGCGCDFVNNPNGDAITLLATGSFQQSHVPGSDDVSFTFQPSSLCARSYLVTSLFQSGAQHSVTVPVMAENRDMCSVLMPITVVVGQLPPSFRSLQSNPAYAQHICVTPM